MCLYISTRLPVEARGDISAPAMVGGRGGGGPIYSW